MPGAPAAAPRPAAPLSAEFREAEAHPIVKDIIRRFAADTVRREPADRAAWLARLGSPEDVGGHGG